MKLTLGKKLGLGFGVILALMVLSAVLTYSKASAIKETQTTITSMRTPTVDACKDLQRELNQTQSKAARPSWREATRLGGRMRRRLSTRVGTRSARLLQGWTTCLRIGACRPTATGWPK